MGFRVNITGSSMAMVGRTAFSAAGALAHASRLIVPPGGAIDFIDADTGKKVSEAFVKTVAAGDAE
jgi:hypothetical protein